MGFQEGFAWESNLSPKVLIVIPGATEPPPNVTSHGNKKSAARLVFGGEGGMGIPSSRTTDRISHQWEKESHLPNCLFYGIVVSFLGG